MAEVNQSNLLKFEPGILKRNARVVIVRTEWNADIVDELEQGALRILRKYGVRNLRTLVVPGAFEIPFAVKHYWAKAGRNKRPQAFIALGCVIRGDTPHFDYVCRAVTDGVLHLNLQLPVPIIFGILTVDHPQQALDRIGGKHGHKGEEAAFTTLKMLQLVQQKAPKKSTR